MVKAVLGSAQLCRQFTKTLSNEQLAIPALFIPRLFYYFQKAQKYSLLTFNEAVAGGDTKSLPAVILRNFTTCSCDVMWQTNALCDPAKREFLEAFVYTENYNCSISAFEQ